MEITRPKCASQQQFCPTSSSTITLGLCSGCPELCTYMPSSSAVGSSTCAIKHNIGCGVQCNHEQAHADWRINA